MRAVAALTGADGHAPKPFEIKIVQMVQLLRNGAPVKMSKRSGNFVTLADVVQEVGKDVVRFTMLTRKPEAQMDFDFAKVIEASKDNPVFYVQYAHARIRSIDAAQAEALRIVVTEQASRLMALASGLGLVPKGGTIEALQSQVFGGIGRLTLIDFDQVDITNCNRQIHAQEGTIGQPKALVMAERCRLINPDVEVEPLQAFYSHENSAELLERGYDYVLDCIDHITAKIHLIETCVTMQLPIISSMGAANKLDPTCIGVADLADTNKCRLARILRRELRRRNIFSGVKTVYSTEEFRPLSDGRREVNTEDAGNYQGQRAPLGSSSVIPPLFGLTMAGEVIRELLEKDS